MSSKMEKQIQRRVAGYHDIRMDGMTDLVVRARGMRIMDIGCNRGLVGFEMANNGAILVHGCDHYAEGIRTARELFADLRSVEAKFETIDLSKGTAALDPFGNQQYDITLVLATYHKLKRVMPPLALSELMRHLAGRTTTFFAWRGTSEKTEENEAEIHQLEKDMKAVGMKMVHRSYISEILGVAAIWKRF